MLISAFVIMAANAQDQKLVLFYAVSVFVSFLIGLLAMARLSHGKPWSRTINLLGAAVVGFTLVMNLVRGLPLISLGAALLIAAGLYLLWVRADDHGVSLQLFRKQKWQKSRASLIFHEILW
jgi:hypothetical protein